MGTAGYPRAVRRRLTIVNAMAFLIALFSAVYALVFAYFDATTYMPLIVINVALMAIALLVPLAHRINDIAGALVIAVAEYAALFFFVAALGHNSGIQINYIIAAAVAFAIYGLSHFRIVVVVIAIGLLLHLAAWYLFPPERALIAADPALLANLYVSSAVTTFCIIALIVGYAFTVADRARAEADALLANILPEAIAERLKERPGERVADSVDEASVLFSDLVGFTELAQRLGAARTVALLDQVVTEFDRLAAAHGVEKIKTTGDGYMAVAGVSQPQADHLPRLARMALRLPDLVERLSATHGVDLKIRIGIAGGPVMAGVIGADKFSYDVWGETVNLASRLESHGLPGEIQVSDAVREALGDSFVFEPRGAIEVKGVGQLETWLLKEERSGAGARGSRLRMSEIWRAVTLTIFPEMFPGPLGLSLAGKALGEGKWALSTIDIRDFATDKHRSVDDTPAGGGAGMVMRADIAAASIDAARAAMPADTPTIYLSPRGTPLTQARVRELAAGPGVILLVRPLRRGRPEGAGRAQGRGGVDRRLCAVRRRACRPGADRRLRAPPAWGGRKRGFACRGELCRRPPRISALHAAARLGGPGHP